MQFAFACFARLTSFEKEDDNNQDDYFDQNAAKWVEGSEFAYKTRRRVVCMLIVHLSLVASALSGRCRVGFRTRICTARDPTHLHCTTQAVHSSSGCCCRRIRVFLLEFCSRHFAIYLHTKATFTNATFAIVTVFGRKIPPTHVLDFGTAFEHVTLHRYSFRVFHNVVAAVLGGDDRRA